MKIFYQYFRFILGVVTFFFSLASISQEYDDLYFTKKDRKKVSYDLQSASNDSKTVYQSYSNDNYQENYSAKRVNPEYIAKYRAQSMNSNQSENTNPNFGLAEDAEYYPENNNYDYQTSTTSDYYINSQRQRSSSFRPSYSIGYNSMFGWGSMFSFSYGSPGFYNPYLMTPVYYNPYWGYDPYWGFDPYFRPYNPYRGYSSIYWGVGYHSYYDPFWGPSVYIPGSYGSFCSISYYNTTQYSSLNSAYRSDVKRRQVVRGARNGRGSTLVTNRRNVADENPSIRNDRQEIASSSRTSATTTRNYSATQNEYFKRSAINTTTGQAYSRTNTSSPSNTIKRSSSGTSSRISPQQQIRSGSTPKTYSPLSRPGNSNNSNDALKNNMNNNRRYNSNTPTTGRSNFNYNSGKSNNFSNPSTNKNNFSPSIRSTPPTKSFSPSRQQPSSSGRSTGNNSGSRSSGSTSTRRGKN